METIKYFIRQRSNLSAVKEKMREREKYANEKNYAYAHKEGERKKNAYRRSIKITISNETAQCQEKPQLGKIGNDVLV